MRRTFVLMLGAMLAGLTFPTLHHAQEVPPEQPPPVLADTPPDVVLDISELLKPVVRAGRISPLSDSWRAVSIEDVFENPVVIAGPPTHEGPDPGVLRIRSVSPDGFEARFREWRYRQVEHDDTHHVDETAPYLVIEEGRSEMPDGSVWVAGTFELDGTRDWKTLTFPERLPGEPKLFLTAQTARGPHPVTVRARDVTPISFDAALFEEGALNDGHTTESIGYLAIYHESEQGAASLGDRTVGYRSTSAKFTDEWERVGPVSLALEEERSADEETEHVEEKVDVLLVDDLAFAQQVSDEGGDTAALRQADATRAERAREQERKRKRAREQRAEKKRAEKRRAEKEPAEKKRAEKTRPETREAVIALRAFSVNSHNENKGRGDDPGVGFVAFRGRMGEDVTFFQTSHSIADLRNHASLSRSSTDTVHFDPDGRDTAVESEVDPFEIFGVCFVFFERDKSDWDSVKKGIHAGKEDAESVMQNRLSGPSPDFSNTSEKNVRYIARKTLAAAEAATEEMKDLWWNHKKKWALPFKDSDDYVGTECAATMNAPGLSENQLEELSHIVHHGSRWHYVEGFGAVWDFKVETDLR